MNISERFQERAKNYYPLVSIAERPASRDWKSNPIDWYAVTPEYAARLVIMSAVLYYRFYAPVLSDDDNDKLVQFVAELPNYKKLSPLRQWQMGDINEFTKNTRRIFVTRMAYQGALHWHRLVKGTELKYPEPEWKLSKEYNTSYIHADTPIAP